jgi:hypothetical protein
MKAKIVKYTPTSYGDGGDNFWYKNKIGEIYEVDLYNSFWYKCRDNNGPARFIRKEDTEIVKDIKLESGMIVELEGGRSGVILNKSVFYFHPRTTTIDGGCWDYLNSDTLTVGRYSNYKIKAVYLKDVDSTYPLSKGKCIYSSKKEVKLNSEYTAEIIGNKVKVGCREFELEKIKEIVRLAEDKCQ